MTLRRRVTDDPDDAECVAQRVAPLRNGSVTKTWLIGILTTLVLGGGAGWMSYVHTQIDAIAGEVKKQKEKDTEVAVIKTKVERLEQDMKDVRGEQKDQSKKLDELLQRVRPSR